MLKVLPQENKVVNEIVRQNAAQFFKSDHRFIACGKICRVFCLPQLPPGFAASEALG